MRKNFQSNLVLVVVLVLESKGLFESRLFCVIAWSALNDSKIEGIVTGAK